MTVARHIDFYLDFVSPFGYLARGRLMHIAKRYHLTVRYHGVDLVYIKRAVGNTGPANRDISAKIAYLTEDLQRWARRYGLSMAGSLPGASTSGMNKGLLLALDKGRVIDYARHAWDCVWRDGLDPGDPTTMKDLGTRMQWDQDEFDRFVDSESAADRYQAENIGAVHAGVFGVPTFVIDGQMWWGNDRLEFLEEYLAIAGAVGTMGNQQNEPYPPRGKTS